MKSLLLVICAGFFGLFPAIAGFPRETVWIVLGPILLGLTYFTLKRHDWPPPLIPWLFACAATARVVAYWWLNSRHVVLVCSWTRKFGFLGASQLFHSSIACTNGLNIRTRFKLGGSEIDVRYVQNIHLIRFAPQ